MLKSKHYWLTSTLSKDKDFNFTVIPSLGPSITQVDQASGSLNNLDSMDVQAACQNSLTQAQDSLMPELVSALPDSYLPLAQQEWLDLRIHNSSRWKLPGFHCLTRSEPWNNNLWPTVILLWHYLLILRLNILFQNITVKINSLERCLCNNCFQQQCSLLFC